ncbi:hypothetical protein KC336_g18355 [Hortaea werneckii]|nr:hypothetical protein KC336_g18355 [Hortaea werneckii]
METVNEELLRTGFRSDLTIKCEGRDFKVHKLIVSTRSPVLARASSNGFLESHTSVIEHVQYDADTVERMIEYIYTVNYRLPMAPTVRVPHYAPNGNGTTANEVTIIGVNAELIMHARLFAIANYYDIAGLRDLALRRFKQDIQTHNLVGFIYVLREMNEIVSKDETRLRGIVHDFCFHNIDSFANDGSFMTALASLPGLQDFTVGLLRKVAQGKEEQKRGLKRELERKDAEIRRIREHRKEKATNTQDVLKTLMGVVVRRLTHKRFGKGEGSVEATVPGRAGWFKDTGDAVQYHSDADIRPIPTLRHTPPVNRTMANVHTQSLLSEVAELWRTGEGSDLTIRCDGREFRVHKLIVSAASPTLKAACQNGMLESQTGVIDHKTFDADTVEMMLEYIYTRDYEIRGVPAAIAETIRTSESDSDAEQALVVLKNAEWITHIRMYAIGDYYQLSTLKDRALEGLQDMAVAPFEPRHFAYVVKEACKLIGKHETGFHHTIQTVCREKAIVLVTEKTFMAALGEVPEMQELAANLLGQVTQELAKQKLDSATTKASQEVHLNAARSNAEMAQRTIEREREAHADAVGALRAQVEHYQARTEKLMDDISYLPLRCPNCRCAIQAPFTLQRETHDKYSNGFVEIRCVRCDCGLTIPHDLAVDGETLTSRSDTSD